MSVAVHRLRDRACEQGLVDAAGALGCHRGLLVAPLLEDHSALGLQVHVQLLLYLYLSVRPVFKLRAFLILLPLRSLINCQPRFCHQ